MTGPAYAPDVPARRQRVQDAVNRHRWDVVAAHGRIHSAGGPGDRRAAVRVRTVGTVGVLVVTYRSADCVGVLLDSLPAAADGLCLRTVVVDNASPDDTVARLRDRADITLVHSGGNYGFAAGLNIGRTHLPGDVDAIAVVNPDAELAPGALRVMADALRDPRVGVAAPRIVGDDGRVFTSMFRDPSIPGAIGEALFGARWRSRPAVLGEIVHHPAAYDRCAQPDWVSGSVLMVAADTARAVGPWDESFFLYSEEMDYAQRVRRAGYGLRFTPGATARHTLGGSGTSHALDALMASNRVRAYRRGHGRVAGAVYRAIVVAHHGLRWPKARHRHVFRVLLSDARRAALPHGDPRDP